MSNRSQKPNIASSRDNLREIAATTLQTLDEGLYEVDGKSYGLKRSLDSLKDGTAFFSDSSRLADWGTVAVPEEQPSVPSVEIIAFEISTLAAARLLSRIVDAEPSSSKRIGILSFASAKNPGGGFINGAQAQEESIARSSTIYPSLMTPTAQKFYNLHKADPKQGFYSHAMIYSPGVLLLRNDKGEWRVPLEVDIVTSAAVNAGVVRRNLKDQPLHETMIDARMRERMARVLYLFEKKGIRNLVLGSFGTGVFQNRVELVAAVWKELLVGETARFRYSFDRVMFAVLGKETFRVFEQTFDPPVLRRARALA